jgi:small-conductance mechanosensitive channel
LLDGLWLVVALAILIAAPAVVGQDVSAPEREVSVAPAARDEDIGARLRGILQTTGWYDALAVDVRDGVVFLDGVAQAPENRVWARDLAAKTQGVVAVVNRITTRDAVDWSFAPAMREITMLARRSVASLPLLALAIVVLPLAWLIAAAVRRLARRALRHTTRSAFLADILARVIAAPVLILGVYIVLQTAGLTQLALSLLGGAGVIGIVIGFAFRDIAENFLASLLLSLRTPFRKGDFIDVGGSMGLVQSMDTRSTLLLSVEGNHITIPNADVFKSRIVNYSTAPARRDTLDVGVGYDVTLAEAQTLILGVLEAHEGVSKNPAPMVLVDSLGSSTVNLRAYYWYDGKAFSPFKLKSALMRLTKGALLEAGVSMPDDAREVIFPQGVPIVEANERPAGAAAAPTAVMPSYEPKTPVSEAEGDLSNEDREIEAQAVAAAPDDKDNLLLNQNR